MRATPPTTTTTTTDQAAGVPPRPAKKPLPPVVDLAQWMGGNRREVFYPFNDVGTYPPRRCER